MKIQNIELRNFRKFESLTVKLDPQMNVIAGNNGVGKSSVLDALSVGIGSFFLGIDKVPTPKIKTTDVRYKTYQIGSRIDRQPQYPVAIECEGNVDGNNISWKRSLNTESGSTTSVDASKIKKISDDIKDRVRKGDQQIILPIISYYGTGRLWSQKKEKQGSGELNLSNRFYGYTDCLSASSNEKLMIKWFRSMTLHRLQEQIEIPELSAVENAIAECFVDSGLTADKVKVRFSVKTDEIEISYLNENGESEQHPFHELSDGFRNTLSLVADIAYRMAVLNPQLLDDVTKKTPGVVLIDEIDQHLHPRWQKNILKSLMKIFPKAQFIVTTHSPIVISSAVRSQLILFDNEKCSYIDDSYGKDSNSVLAEIMGVSPRPEDVQKKLDRFYETLDDEEFDKAKEILGQLTEMLGEGNGDVVSAKVALDFETC